MGPPANLVPRALTIAGSDSGGGAGIQADLKTFLALGVHGMSAVTALTAQNTLGVSAVVESSPEFVREQISQVVTDIGVDATKTGMLSNASIVEAVAAAVDEFELTNLVVDPVFISKGGHKLLADDAVDTLRAKLLPKATMITPNLHETGVLLGREVASLEEMKRAAADLLALGPRSVIVKGGHLAGRAIDIFYDGDAFVEYEAERLQTRSLHGTGCTFSAAICANLAKGEGLIKAGELAKQFVTGAIKNGLDVGGGHAPTNHGWDSSLADG